MLIGFFLNLRRYKLPVSITELLTLLEALQQRLVFADMDDFYCLARVCLVKDEKYFDKFDRAFAAYFKNLDTVEALVERVIPEEWLRAEFLKQLTEEEKAKVRSLGGLEKLLEEFKKRLGEQKKRHSGGNRWIGTGGTSPFGNSGYHPGGIRVGGKGRHRSASKVWEKRQFRDLDDSIGLGTRNIQVALRKLRKFARTGAAEELDLDNTISSTARNGGLLDIQMVPERHNAIKVLLFFDVGGSMDPYVRVCEALFSACRSEFKHLEYFYFHNFVYEHVWRNNQRRFRENTSLLEILRTYGKDYKVIFVGDASMAPYEITGRYGSVEHMNDEPGAAWMERVTSTYGHLIWLNPVDEAHWQHTPSIGITQRLVGGHMYPMTLEGLDRAIACLVKGR
ncbi:VWA domain-containing protein [Microbulbifer sp. 2205BS26-8]|uniref:vWA domain-containing protein n=1 Tax=Microbulbifer sp. 2205BS26-8 TaxID=3064386 RepID=UPI00273CF766|nr:VWA domain-containing protein [Microbulbifer sp. 2205BS26-8]MDP5209224.1 VWA domain-containing protein [Microbulbifer sp. 2205BS26-8]